MNTPTHTLINWTVAKWWSEAPPRSAVLLGSVAPDLPLYGLSIGGAIWYRWVQGWEPVAIARHMYGTLFFHNPWWISLHNLLHSPLVLMVALVWLYFYLGNSFRTSWWTWFFSSCLLHTLVDIPVHHDDGPLVFWPLNWSYRFASPLSYWDVRHYGAIVMRCEAVLFLVLAVHLIYRWWRGPARQTSQASDT